MCVGEFQVGVLSETKLGSVISVSLIPTSVFRQDHRKSEEIHVRASKKDLFSAELRLAVQTIDREATHDGNHAFHHSAADRSCKNVVDQP